MAPMQDAPAPSLFLAMKRGLKGACPACGKGPLFWRYLKVEPHCQACGHDLARYPADDGPAYFTILLVGHLIVAPLLFFPIVWESSPLVSIPLIVIPLAGLTLAILPRIKGAFIGVLYAMGVKEADAHLHTADIVE